MAIRVNDSSSPALDLAVFFAFGGIVGVVVGNVGTADSLGCSLGKGEILYSQHKREPLSCADLHRRCLVSRSCLRFALVYGRCAVLTVGVCPSVDSYVEPAFCELLWYGMVA